MTETTTARYPHVDYSSLPEAMQVEARAYIEHAAFPDRFLWAVLMNDLPDALLNADFTKIAAMRPWAQWLYSEAPAACWGPPARGPAATRGARR